ncbi:MAG: type restriction enzyme, partial [Actinomycetota bacterium]|nr:type restriction enzyme [Actinomycetota bacterium]
SARPRKATPEFFAGKIVTDEIAGAAHEVTIEEGKQLQYWLTVNGFIDYDQHLTDRWHDRANLPEIPDLPAGLQPYFYQVIQIVESLNVDVPQAVDGRKPKRIPLNEANFAKKEFQELWSRINHKAVYQVEFESSELIRNCVTVLDKSLTVAAMQYVVVSGEQRDAIEADQVAAGESFTVTTSRVEESSLSAASTVKYDLLGEIAEKTQLTRRTCAAILTGVLPTTFALFKQNPEQFITETSRLINEQKATVIIEHLSYDPLADEFDSSIFTENQSAQDFTKSGEKLKKSVYEYVVTDSKVERSFVTELDTSDEVVVYSKLPRGFFIPTPVGDYNPDWAIAFKEGGVKHVYFVAETKGSLSSLQLKGVENAKIECARTFFAAVNKKAGTERVVYDVVTGFDELMQLVGVGP